MEVYRAYHFYNKLFEQWVVHPVYSSTYLITIPSSCIRITAKNSFIPILTFLLSLKIFNSYSFTDFVGQKKKINGIFCFFFLQIHSRPLLWSSLQTVGKTGKFLPWVRVWYVWDFDARAVTGDIGVGSYRLSLSSIEQPTPHLLTGYPSSLHPLPFSNLPGWQLRVCVALNSCDGETPSRLSCLPQSVSKTETRALWNLGMDGNFFFFQNILSSSSFNCWCHHVTR